MDIGAIWNATLVHPLELALIALGEWTGSGGWAIILFTIVVKLVLFPLTWKQIQGQKAMMVIQPLIREAQRRYGSDRVRLNEEMMRIYREHNVNPAAGCLPLLIQLPIWFALYQALRNLGADNPIFQQGFLWVERLDQPDHLMLPFFEGPVPNPILPLLTAITQWAIQRMMTAPTQDPQMQQMNRTMQFMPFIFLFMSLNFPAGLVLYWVTSNVVSMVQQYFLTGWGELFPGGRRPRTPLAGSWEPRPVRSAPPSAPASEPAGAPSEAAVDVAPSDGRLRNGGRAARRGGKEKRRGAKR
ncbi:MAG: membrane protein insertase YidC [Chloroflexi bacterium]|nr:membrane protein insertase YidC [Chloroflexota bacterium]